MENWSTTLSLSHTPRSRPHRRKTHFQLVFCTVTPGEVSHNRHVQPCYPSVSLYTTVKAITTFLNLTDRPRSSRNISRGHRHTFELMEFHRRGKHASRYRLVHRSTHCCLQSVRRFANDVIAPKVSEMDENEVMDPVSLAKYTC